MANHFKLCLIFTTSSSLIDLKLNRFKLFATGGFKHTLNRVPEFGPILANTVAAEEEEKTNVKSPLP